MNNCRECGNDEFNEYPGWEYGETVKVCTDCGEEYNNYK